MVAKGKWLYLVPDINSARLIGASILALLSASCLAETYVEAKLSGGGTILTIKTDSGSTHVLRTNKDEVNFSDVKISSDKLNVGWLVETYCCGSYPLPVALVIFKEGRIVRRFDDESIFLVWNFALNDDAVVYATQTAHFITGTGYALRSISSGKVLQYFGCDIPYIGKRHVISKHVPRWVWALRDAGKGGCPYTDTNIEE